MSPDEGKRLLHELMATGLPNFLFPDTDLIAGFAPFSNLPNQYRITEEHARKWSGFSAERATGILSCTDMVAIMSTPRHRERLNGHYVSSVASYAEQFFDTLRQVTRKSPFLDPAPQ